MTRQPRNSTVCSFLVKSRRLSPHVPTYLMPLCGVHPREMVTLRPDLAEGYCVCVI